MQLHANQGRYTGEIFLDGEPVGAHTVFASEELGVVILIVTIDDIKPYKAWRDEDDIETKYKASPQSRRLYFPDLEIDIDSPVLMQKYGKVTIASGEFIPREVPE